MFKYEQTASYSASKVISLGFMIYSIPDSNLKTLWAGFLGNAIGSFIQMPCTTDKLLEKIGLIKTTETKKELGIKKLLDEHYSDMTGLNAFTEKKYLRETNGITNKIKEIFGQKNTAPDSIILEKSLVWNCFQKTDLISLCIDLAPALILGSQAIASNPIYIMTIPAYYLGSFFVNLGQDLNNSLLDQEAIRIDYSNDELESFLPYLPEDLAHSLETYHYSQ